MRTLLLVFLWLVMFAASAKAQQGSGAPHIPEVPRPIPAPRKGECTGMIRLDGSCIPTSRDKRGPRIKAQTL